MNRIFGIEIISEERSQHRYMYSTLFPDSHCQICRVRVVIQFPTETLDLTSNVLSLGLDMLLDLN